MGDVRSFDNGDMRLLETVAAHAGMALQNSRLIDQLRHESLHDALTGLPNRVLLRNDTVDELLAIGREQSRGCAIMIMDLDGFKEVNDTLGHQHGDELLKAVASRTVDAAGSRVTVARLGGDEFALMVPDCPDASEARDIAARVLAALRPPTILDGIPVQVGASIGVALAPFHAADVTGLLRYADVAMYGAKSAGGGVKVYESDSDTSSPDRLAMITELRDALDMGELGIHVQPKASLTGGTTAAVEVLARWDHPRRGVLFPDEFIPLAERSGLIHQLTVHVLRLALHSCAEWRDLGTEVSIAVNLSPRSLVDPGLCATVSQLLVEAEVPARLLTLEITESTVMADPELAVRSLQSLRALGVRLSVDDFGVGHSSLSNLRRLPVQELKIDRSFVAALGNDVDSAVIVRSIVDLGRNLALDVVAEGVETKLAWDRLQAMGCQVAQGYFVARPMAPELLLGWLQRWNRQHPAAPSAVAARSGLPG
jgi:diguanylate cyclase (GGDEF)-like protein